MVNAKRKDDASSSKSNSEINNVVDPAQTETTGSSPITIDLDEIVVVPDIEEEEENGIEEMKTEENATDEEMDEENLKEVEENNEENAIEEEENDDENAIEEEENNEENAIEEEVNGEETAIEKVGIEKNSVAEGKNEQNAEEGLKDKTNKLKKRNRRNKVATKGSEAVAAKDKDKPESSGKKKAKKKVESMGMIFMCSSKTKKDCFRYNVLGLPATKKDIVQKIYKGMRVFLFDFDLRLMYGIYKAAGPGGYNIEPKAFKSAFPSQVRFTVCEDCLPLAEEKFRKVIKENYFSKNKFDCQLNATQVKNLCKLFLAANKGTKSKRPGTSRRAEPHTFVDRDRVGPRARDDERRPVSGGARRFREEERRTEPGRKRRYRDEERRDALVVKRRYRNEERRDVLGGARRYPDEERLPALGGDRLYHERPVVYEREVFASPVASLSRIPHLPPPAPAAYTYRRTSEMDASYRREPIYEHRERQLLDLDQRPRVVIEQRDPYPLYREPREPPLYRDSLYAGGPPPEYHHPASVASEYRTAGLATEYRNAGLASEYRPLPSEYRPLAAVPPSEYRSAAAAPPEYTSHRPLYRY